MAGRMKTCGRIYDSIKRQSRNKREKNVMLIETLRCLDPLTVNTQDNVLNTINFLTSSLLPRCRLMYR
jgi:hypothetical protein